ncbi:hypothetical protein J7T55_013230 [Diaporthe amygdali]|uniref:uncharacterized protein n=1 Tax=Phomopsis amygdali TaxID=1214568 RepID=UPI0022FEEDDE|nr:uncharacterized protein J7T55_013230 [Diaporthe amygdali]KAJ0118995.1 hypothetical protein J7T55_013230 [Diaporthe amygdali]
MSLADPSFGSDSAVILYAGVWPWNKGIVTQDKLVVFLAGMLHRQCSQGNVFEKHLTINTPAPEPDRYWNFGVALAPNGIGHYGILTVASEMNMVLY